MDEPTSSVDPLSQDHLAVPVGWRGQFRGLRLRQRDARRHGEGFNGGGAGRKGARRPDRGIASKCAVDGVLALFDEPLGTSDHTDRVTWPRLRTTMTRG